MPSLRWRERRVPPDRANPARYLDRMNRRSPPVCGKAATVADGVLARR
ncbi:hypothetical protein [Micromonospora sp. NPDC049679]